MLAAGATELLDFELVGHCSLVFVADIVVAATAFTAQFDKVTHALFLVSGRQSNQGPVHVKSRLIFGQ